MAAPLAWMGSFAKAWVASLTNSSLPWGLEKQSWCQGLDENIPDTQVSEATWCDSTTPPFSALTFTRTPLEGQSEAANSGVGGAYSNYKALLHFSFHLQMAQPRRARTWSQACIQSCTGVRRGQLLPPPPALGHLLLVELSARLMH